MVADIGVEPHVKFYGEYSAFEGNRQNKEQWKTVNSADALIPRPDPSLPNLRFSIVEQVDESQKETKRRVMIEVEPDRKQIGDRRFCQISAPLGDFYTGEYWKTDEIGGQLYRAGSRIESQYELLDNILNEWVAHDEETRKFNTLPWLKIQDLTSTNQAIIDELPKERKSKWPKEFYIVPGEMKAFVHITRVLPVVSHDVETKNRNRDKLQHIKINFTELHKEGIHKGRFKRIKTRNGEKLLPLEFTKEQWMMMDDNDIIELKVLISSKVPALIPYLDSVFKKLNTLITEEYIWPKNQ